MVAAIGIVCSTQRFHSALHNVLIKVFERGQSPTPISAEKYSAKDSYRIEIGCAFFVTFFAQANKVNECAHETKVSPVSAIASKLAVVPLLLSLHKQRK